MKESARMSSCQLEPALTLNGDEDSVGEKVTRAMSHLCPLRGMRDGGRQS